MRSLLVAAALLASGCDSCGGGDPVPFGLDGQVRPRGEEPDDPGPTTERPSEGRALPAGTRRVDVEGAPIERDTALRVLFAHDIDGDGDRDAVLVAEGAGPERPAVVLYAQREGAAFRAPREIGHAAPAAEGCALRDASIRTVGRWLIARAAIGCEDGPGAEELFVVSIDGAVRVEERLAVLPRDEPGATRLAFGVDDVDEDGRDDLTVEVALMQHDVEDRINLHWLDRPSGLARQSSEPNATLNTRSREALRQLRGDPAAALEASRAVLRLHRALCREPGAPRVRVGSAAGLECGDSEGAGRAITTVVRAHARRGETMLALDAFAAMEEPGRRITDERREYARRALGSLPSQGGVTVTDGPTVTPPPPRAHTLSALGFLDEDHVLVRATTPMRWEVGAGLEPADPQAADARVLDPQKRFAVAALETRCGAVRMRITPAGGPAALGAPASTPILWGGEGPCEAEWVDGAAGWRLLGWAPQGIVAARGAELRVVPLDVAALPSGEARTLAEGALPPAPLPAGRSTLDGRFHVELRGPAVLVHEQGRAPALLWPEGWTEREATPSHPAISPSGRRVALVQGGRLVLLERGARD